MAYVTTGKCFYCLEPLEALQPGGLNPQHVADQVPYGQCREAVERPKWEPEQIWNGEPLVNETEFPLKNQDYTVPHYTDEQKHQMIENYIRRLSEPRDDAPLIIENGRLVRLKQDHDHDGN